MKIIHERYMDGLDAGKRGEDLISDIVANDLCDFKVFYHGEYINSDRDVNGYVLWFDTTMICMYLCFRDMANWCHFLFFDNRESFDKYEIYSGKVTDEKLKAVSLERDEIIK